MRLLIVAVLVVVALWQAWVDWQATIGAGFAYRLTPLGAALDSRWPETYAAVTEAWRDSGLAWEPVGTTLMAVPLALIPAGLAALLWFTRRRGRRA